MALVRWDPVRELASMEIDRLDHMFTNLYGEGPSRSWVPPVDIYETEQREVVIKAELPDVNKEDVEVTVENNTLTLKGTKGLPTDVKEEQFRRVERRYGSFARSFTLPNTVDASKVSAEFKNGVLTVKLPYREEAKPRTINVDVAA